MRALLRLTGGLIVWAIGFSVIYALHGMGCANDWPSRTIGGFELHRLALFTSWVATVAVTTAIALWSIRNRAGTLADAAILANGAAALAALVTFMPILAVPHCL